MSFPRYPKYKPSGVEWLGDVPEGWVVCPPKRRIKSSAGGTSIKGTCADEPADGLFPGFSASGQNIWLEEYAYDCPAIVLSAVGARCGKAFKADGQWGVVANTHCLFPRPDSDRDYLWYLTNQEDWWEKGGSAQPFVKVSETLARPWVFPPLAEQTAIAEFLDRETGKIDELVAEQRRLVELLKEKRQAVISHAVTKGLNPSAPMKPSGIEWLGDVPEGWKVRRLKSVVEEPLKYGANESAELDDRTLPRFVRITDIDDSGALRDETFKSLPVEVAEPFLLREGDVLLARSGATVGKSFIYSKEWGPACYAGYLIRARLRQTVCLAQWLYYFCQTAGYWGYVLGSQIQATIQNVSAEKYANLYLPVPSIVEQTAIIQFLDTQLAKFDTLTAEAQRVIDLLQERRTALISAAVTGQIDVRNNLRN